VADIARLERALVNADKAGDTDAARILAAEIKKAKAAPVVRGSEPVQQKGFADTALPLVKGLITGGPVGLAAAGMREGLKGASELMDRGAYMAGGAATDALAGKVPPEVAGAAGYLANVGIQAVPTLLGAAAGSIPGSMMKSGARSMMQSALKPGKKALETGKGQAAVETLLKKGVNVTEGGVAKLRSQVDDINAAVEQALKASGASVDKGKVASRVQDVIGKIERTNPTPQDAIRDVEKVYEQFLANKIIPDKIPVSVAQRLKQGIYKVLKDKYGVLGSDTVEAQKALARGLKEEIANVVPEISKLNAKESELLNALVLAEQRTLMAGNKNPAGLTFLATNPKAAAAFLADRSELFKSIVARLMYSAGSPTATATGAGLGALYGAGSASP